MTEGTTTPYLNPQEGYTTAYASSRQKHIIRKAKEERINKLCKIYSMEREVATVQAEAEYEDGSLNWVVVLNENLQQFLASFR
jgi:hypothetical protein